MIYCCVLKGKTTSEEQFKRFLDSYRNAIVNSPQHIFTYYFYDTDEAKASIEKKFKGEDFLRTEYKLLKRNDDAGELRNEFLARLTLIDEKIGDCFTFFDGDDTISPNYFNFNPAVIYGRGFAICNPIAVYGEEETDKYPLKWCQVLSTTELYNAILLDKKGCQCWGTFYEIKLAKESCFGRGLFEDVTFWYRLARKYRNPVLFWDKVYYWYRNNPKAITRTMGSFKDLKEGIKNLEFAKDISLLDYKPTDERVWRRYTIGMLILLRNSQSIEDKYALTVFLQKSIDKECFYPRMIQQMEPKLWENVKKDYPNLEVFCYGDSE
jgi:hypothetical protein